MKKKIVHKLPWYGNHSNLCGTRVNCYTMREMEWTKVTCPKCLKINKDQPGEW